MKTLLLLLALITLPCTCARAQNPPPRFALTGAIGLADQAGERNPATPAFSLSTDFHHRLGYRLWAVTGLGIQQGTTRHQTMVDAPPPFVAGWFPVDYRENERFSVRGTEAFARLGFVYGTGRLRVGMAALPAYRLGGKFNYQFSREFMGPSEWQEDLFISETARSGERVSAMNPSDVREVRIRPLAVRAEASVNYAVFPGLRVGLAVRPTVVGRRLSHIVYGACEPNCPQPTPEAWWQHETLRSTDFMLTTALSF